MPNGEIKDFGKINAVLIPLTIDELRNDLNKNNGHKSLINEFIYLITPGTNVDLRYAFIRVDSESFDANLSLVSVFIVDAIRFYTGANIELGPTISLYPSEVECNKTNFPIIKIPNRLSQFQGYVFNDNIIEGFRKFLNIFGEIYLCLNKVEDIKIAFRYLERTFGFLDGLPFEDKILFTTIALEALFSPSSNQELKYRVCQNASVFLGSDENEREKIFSTIYLAYDIRSSVAHGSFVGFQKYESKFKKIGYDRLYDFCDYLNYFTRESIIRRAIIYNKDSSCNKQKVNRILENFCRHTNSLIKTVILETITQPVSIVKRK